MPHPVTLPTFHLGAPTVVGPLTLFPIWTDAPVPDMPVALLTANVQDEIIAQARALKLAFVPKPATEEGLRGFLAAAITPDDDFAIAREYLVSGEAFADALSAAPAAAQPGGALLLRFAGDLSALRTWVSLGLSRLVVSGVAVAGLTTAAQPAASIPTTRAFLT